MTKDYYELLGVSPQASQREITTMYRKLSKKYHPDKHAEDPDLMRWAEGMMKDLNEAYTILRDPVKRAEYDQQRLTPSPPPRPTEVRYTYTVVSPTQPQSAVAGPAFSALSFGLLSLTITRSLIFAFLGAGLGYYLGKQLSTIRISWIFYGAIIGGILLSRFGYQGFLVGTIIGALLGFGLSQGK